MIWLWFTWTSLGYANGQSSHLWISEQAIACLPSGGLKDLLTNPNLERHWRNGTMFPDGGYAVGDDYGEIAHWEPFQRAYLDWIRTTYSIPWSADAQKHIAFLMGLASHGLADQSYDAMYFRRAYVYDVDSNWAESFDVATDVALVYQTQPQPTVDVWIPQVVYELYEQQGHSVSSTTVEQGQNRLNLAVFWVGSTASQSQLRDEYFEQYPWGTENQLADLVPGNPPMEVEIVVGYWQTLWALLHETQVQPVLLFTHPRTESYEHPRDYMNIESSLSMGLSVGIDEESLLPEHISVVDETGAAHPVMVDVFYGSNSHIINIEPLENWSTSTFTVTLDADLPLSNGERLGETLVWNFSTRAIPDADVSEGDETRKGCSALGFELCVWTLLVTVLGCRRRQM